jgi:YHS domain-containing protein
MIMERSNLNELDLIDPVCGITVSMLAPHTCIHGGAMFFFCSKECRSLFRANPAHFVVINILETSIIEIEAGANELHISKEPDYSAVNSTSPRQTEKNSEHQNVIRDLRSHISSWMQARQERRHVVVTCKELLALYSKVSADHPKLGKRQLTKMLVMARNNCNEKDAYEVLKFAEESYAAWPVERELTLCDVIHYLTVTEFTSNYGVEYSGHINFRPEIRSLIPSDLCHTKKKETHSSERRKTLRFRSI